MNKLFKQVEDLIHFVESNGELVHYEKKLPISLRPHYTLEWKLSTGMIRFLVVKSSCEAVVDHVRVDFKRARRISVWQEVSLDERIDSVKVLADWVERQYRIADGGDTERLINEGSFGLGNILRQIGAY